MGTKPKVTRGGRRWASKKKTLVAQLLHVQPEEIPTGIYNSPFIGFGCFSYSGYVSSSTFVCLCMYLSFICEFNWKHLVGSYLNFLRVVFI